MLHTLLNSIFPKWAGPTLALSRRMKRSLVLALDTAFCILSVQGAFYLRLEEWPGWKDPAITATTVSLLLALPIFIKLGLYRSIFRYSGFPAVKTVIKAMTAYLALFVLVFTVWGVDGVPRTVGLIQPALLGLLVAASRILARIWLGDLYRNHLRSITLPQALIYGAGSAGRQLVGAMANSLEIRIVGMLDDDPRLHGHLLNGLPIHNPADLKDVLEGSSITDILLAMPSASRQRRNEIIQRLKSHKVSVRTLPGLSDIVTGKVSMSELRELDIDDLLGRDPVAPHSLLLNLNIQQKTVLVTGAGGSIGSELCRQILQSRPARLLLVERNEFALYQIHQELEKSLTDDLPRTDILPLLASVCDVSRMTSIMQTWRPHTVYHAAAYKHVPLVEHNPVEGLHNNVWGTKVCAEAAIQCGVSNFVLVSTDKAVRPTNIMGASKRLAEMVLQALAASKGSSTVLSMVRFGNVLGSSGSVVPLFRQQIKSGGPITLTHPNITRYFMSIPEAAQLVIQAGAMGQGGDVFVLDMGEPVKIMDLATRMVQLSGLTVKDERSPDGDIEMSITGLRPGEKLYEELLIGENPQLTQHPRIMKAQEHYLPWDELQGLLANLQEAMQSGAMDEMRSLLEKHVGGYQPSGHVVDWVHLARQSGA